MTLPSFSYAVSSVTETGYAKINLCLHITGRRKDGYHLLDSLVVFADVGDELTLVPAEAPSLHIHGEFAPLIAVEGNHAMLACEAVRKAMGLKEAVAIHLTKNLPVGAGLGGGSSDAAAVARGMNRLFGLGLSDVQLAEILLPLGADMPACTHARPLRMQGIGENITHLFCFPLLYVLLVHPRKALSTPSVFKALQVADFVEGLQVNDGEWEDKASLIHVLQNTENTLEKAALRVMPEIADMLRELSTLPEVQLARMSGSGSACFALFDNQPALESAQRKLRQSRPEWWIAGGRILSGD